MSFFSKLSSFFKNIFDRARPGLEKFLSSEDGQAITRTVRNVVASAVGRKFNDLKPIIFGIITAKTGDKIPGTWISLAIDFSYEQIKAEALKQADKLNRVSQ